MAQGNTQGMCAQPKANVTPIHKFSTTPSLSSETCARYHMRHPFALTRKWPLLHREQVAGVAAASPPATHVAQLGTAQGVHSRLAVLP